jgi:hypothetical protein
MDDKKKLVILGSLFLVIIAVGAFQFSKGGGSEVPAEPVAKSKEASTDTESTVASKTGDAESENTEEGQTGEGVDPALIAAARLNPRDPFDGAAWDANRVPAQVTPVAPPQPRVAPPMRPTSMGGSGFKPIPIGEGALPTPEGSSTPITGGKLPSIEDFPYTVAGTMVGDRPCVLLTDSTGKQKLVNVGGSIDGDSQVVSVSKGAVTVRHRGKTKTFRVSGMSPSNNKYEDKQ